MREPYAKLPLSKVASIERGKFSARPRNDPKYYGGEIPFLQTVDIARAGRVIQGWTQTLNELGLGVSKMFPRGTIFMSIAANIGDVAISGFDAACPDSVVAVKPRNGFDPEWLFQSLKFSKNDLAALSTQNAQANLSLEKIEPFKISVPPLPEQRKIAAILRTWDEALEKLTALRAAKERRLAGVGRALLARAADDPATVTRPLATLARIVKGQQLNKLDISDGDYPVWNGGITPSGFHNDWNTEGGTITISEGGNSCGFVNLADRPFWLGGHCYALRNLSQEVERDFLFHALKSREPEIMRLRVGSGLPNIQRADLERLAVVVPPRDLQERIASALTAGNAEITLLNTEIEALRNQKRGLMQKLLTGEWRVKLEAPVA